MTHKAVSRIVRVRKRKFLSIQLIVGGEAEILKKVQKVLESIGDVIVHVGDVGHINIAKLINNMISFGCANIVFEGMVLVAKADIEMRM